jgi:hypothetical protein
MQRILDDFKKHNSYSIDLYFPNEIKENFLKILTNTFYLNLKKVSLQLKKDLFDERILLSDEEMKNKISQYYLNSLSETRKKILEYFKIQDTELRAVSLLRSYVFTLPRSNEVRKKYEKFNEILSKVENNLKNRIIPEEYIDKTNNFCTDEIKDVK